MSGFISALVRHDRLMSVRRRFGPSLVMLFDLYAWSAAIVGGVWLRYEFRLDLVDVIDLARVLAVAVLAHLLLGGAVGLYRRRWRFGSFDEAVILAGVVAAVGSLTFAWTFAVSSSVPRSAPLIATTLAALLMVTSRSFLRLLNSRASRPRSAEPIVVIGAGDASEHIVRALLGLEASRLLPVAIVDDDPKKRRLRVMGVPVVGTIDDLSATCSRLGVGTALMATPSAPQELRRKVARAAADAGVQLLIVPSMDSLILGTGSDGISGAAPDIRPVTETDLLGRPPAAIDPDEISAYLTGRRVLVTGAGGSIGSELCRTIARFNPASLVMVDRDESGLHATQLSIDGRAMLDSRDLELADLRDRPRLRQIFDDHRPEVVFHAAALKHLPLLEMYPEEAWKSNVVVTHDLLEIALEHGVDRFVNISTDKAADPTSVLGWTKRIGERLTADAARRARAGQNYISVRFGNVLGSRGSVLTAFEAQVHAGGPITVTHPEVTRYFMTIEEAARLTVYAGAIGRPAEVLVLDMGEPVLILDVARRFAQRAEPALEVVFTSLRHGEKVHEVLFASDERDRRPIHPLISHVDVPRLDWASCVDPGDVADASVIARVAVERPPVDVDR